MRITIHELTGRLNGFRVIGLRDVAAGRAGNPGSGRALATVIAIVAIVAMFRGGSTGDDHGHAEAESSDEDDEEPHAAEPTEVTAAATRGADSGPTAVPVGLSGPQDDLFTMSANASPRKSMP